MQVHSEAKQSAQVPVDARGGRDPEISEFAEVTEVTNVDGTPSKADTQLLSRSAIAALSSCMVRPYAFLQNAAADQDDICRSTAVAAATTPVVQLLQALHECVIEQWLQVVRCSLGCDGLTTI